ncbi:uncharacterized protein LOC123295330 [Chrysoperla carnea]|uniref:uncharacterized protein LOC123295330 n=1 Tax=Chrysoperla carnea TaxID=189513 RepID=UPI001D05D2F1|nr:uncharacterized protein LOC123295330 [Chrysoperla carnea]
MWFSLILNDKNYIFKSFYDDETFSVYCSDFENIWVENLKTNDICNRFQLLNNVEMPAAKLKAKLHSLFYENRDGCNFILQSDENQALNVKLRTKFSSKDIEMDFKLKKETTICVRKIYR